MCKLAPLSNMHLERVDNVNSLLILFHLQGSFLIRTVM